MFRRAFKTATVLAGLGLAAMSPTAFAVPVTWQVVGSIDTLFVADPDEAPPGLADQAGQVFSFDLTFDTDGVLTADRFNSAEACLTTDVRCLYSTTISFANFRIGSVDIPGVITFDQPDDLMQIFVRNNANGVVGGISTLTDGISFGVTDPGAFNDDGTTRQLDSWSLIFRTTDLSLLDSDAIPGVPPPGLAELPISEFSLCSSSTSTFSSNAQTWFAVGTPCDQFRLQGRITSVSSVPEPGTFGLISFGLAGMLLAARRRRSGHPAACPQT